jgi:hypothetical protein
MKKLQAGAGPHGEEGSVLGSLFVDEKKLPSP